MYSNVDNKKLTFFRHIPSLILDVSISKFNQLLANYRHEK